MLDSKARFIRSEKSKTASDSHTFMCLTAFACRRFLDLLIITFLEPAQVKERRLANREGVGSLPGPESEPRPMMWSGRCVPSEAGPANPGQTGQGTHC